MLKQVLLKQLEYYFSRKNLATDSFLVSQMNAELFVPVSIVAQFAKIQALTTDEALLLDVMKSSPHLIVDQVQRRVRPNFQVQRNTLILRDIPSDADPSVSSTLLYLMIHGLLGIIFLLLFSPTHTFSSLGGGRAIQRRSIATSSKHQA